MKRWLQTTGSPQSRIDKAEFLNEKEIKTFTFDSFKIKSNIISLRTLKFSMLKMHSIIYPSLAQGEEQPTVRFSSDCPNINSKFVLRNQIYRLLWC
jgi:hypothetical protein